MKRLFFLALFSCAFYWLRADSPLTSTYFCTAYNDVPQVVQAISNAEQGNHRLTAEHISFLDDPAVGLDVKLALINALGWGDSTNTEILKQHLITKYTLNLQDVSNWCNADYLMDSIDFEKIHRLDYQDLTLFAYTQAMGDYFNPLRAIYFSEAAMDNDPASEAVIWIQGLIMAQFYLDVDWCAVYMVFQDVESRTSTFE